LPVVLVVVVAAAVTLLMTRVSLTVVEVVI
jgi:hypothetical protein